MQFERLGPYRITRKLGRGGMGAVFEGVHVDTGQHAAVKLLSAALADDDDFRDRFQGEIETLRKLRHDNIVQLFGFGEQDEHLFYAMELVEGDSLEQELGRGRRFDWREVTRLSLDMCKALRHAHDRGIIHRDIKPANLLLSKQGVIKLSDFGISRFFGNVRLTAAGSIIGTAEYMAPEQAAGKPVDHRSDLYSLGAVMYSLLARRPVFRSKSLAEALQKQQFEKPERLRKFNPEVPEEFEQIIAQLLEKDPARRIPNAMILGRLLEAMRRALAPPSETLAAGPDFFSVESEPTSVPEAFVPPVFEIAQTIDLTAAQAANSEAPSGLATVDLSTAPPLPGNSEETPLKTLELSEVAPAISSLATAAINANEPTGEEQPSIILSYSAAPNVEKPLKEDRFVVVDKDELDKEEFSQRESALISWQTYALVVSLTLIAAAAWYFLQPESADSLYNRVAKSVTSDSLSEAAGDIEKFLSNYSSDPRAGQLREYQDQLELDTLNKKYNQILLGSRSSQGLTPVERAYIEALSTEKSDPERAATKLQALISVFGRDGDSESKNDRCVILAQRKLDKIQSEIKRVSDDQLRLIRRRLAEADEMRRKSPEKAADLYRAVLELYGDKPWAAEVVEQAKKSLATP